MRQRDDLEFASALRRLADGQLSPTDLTLLKSRECATKDVPAGTLQLFYTNAEADGFNGAVLGKCKDKITMSAKDHAQGQSSTAEIEKMLQKARNSRCSETYNLPSELVLSAGIHYMMTVNVDVADGLVNGTVGTLAEIEYKNEAPATLWFDFGDEDVGKLCRKNNVPHQKNSSLTPVFLVTKSFRLTRHSAITITRTQFPIVPAEAITIHKSQGATYPMVAVHLTPRKLNIYFIVLNHYCYGHPARHCNQSKNTDI